MVLTPDDTDDIGGMLTRLDDTERYHRAKLEEAQRDREAVRRVYVLRLQQEAEAAEDDRAGSHSHIAPQDIALCTSIKAACAEIAQRSEGTLQYHVAARLIIAAKLSESKNPTSLARDIRKQLAASADWSHDSPGVYRYLPYGNGKGYEPSSTVQAPASPAFRPGGSGGGPS